MESFHQWNLSTLQNQAKNHKPHTENNLLGNYWLYMMVSHILISIIIVKQKLIYQTCIFKVILIVNIEVIVYGIIKAQ